MNTRMSKIIGVLFSTILLFPLVSTAKNISKISENKKDAMIEQFDRDFPKMGEAYRPMLQQEELWATTFVAQSYLQGGMCSQASDWMSLIETKDKDEYSEILATAMYNGDCYQQNKDMAVSILQTCSKTSPSCVRKLLMALAQNNNQPKVFLNSAKKLANIGDFLGTAYLSLAYSNGVGTIVDYKEAYFWALIAIQNAFDDNDRNFLLSSLPQLKSGLSKKEIDNIDQKAKKWSPKKLPESQTFSSHTSSTYALDLGPD